MDITPRTTVKEERDILDSNMTAEKSIKILEKPLIPRDIIESDLSLSSYLEQNINDNRRDEMIRLKLAKAREAQRRKYLIQKEKQIKVEPNTKQPIVIEEEKRKVVICKQEPKTTETREGSLVVQKRIGIVVVCDKCTHRFTHYSKDIGKQYFCCCSRCHANIRLKHYK